MSRGPREGPVEYGKAAVATIAHDAVRAFEDILAAGGPGVLCGVRAPRPAARRRKGRIRVPAGAGGGLSVGAHQP